MVCDLERMESNEDKVLIIWCSIRIRHRKLFGIKYCNSIYSDKNIDLLIQNFLKIRNIYIYSIPPKYIEIYRKCIYIYIWILIKICPIIEFEFEH